MRPFLEATCALGAVMLALAGLFCGCSRTGPQDGQPMSIAASGSLPGFLGQIAAAPFQNAYFARRRVWQIFQEANGIETLEYTESVWSDGQGHFSVTPEDVLQPTLPAQSEQIFLLMQKAREGFVYRLRDFRIQELDSFLLAYMVEDLDQQVSVAGQTCERLRIRAVNAGPSYWELDVEPASGLILATREFLQDSTPVAVVETLEYRANPTLDGITLHQDLPAVPFTPATAEEVLGFTPLLPTFLPQDFVLVKSEKLSQGTLNWARFSYSNGGETLFLLYRHEAPATEPSKDPAGPYTIKIFRAGRWTVAQAAFDRHRIIAIGREPATILQQIVESAAP